MREIKFRAWIKSQKKWYGDDTKWFPLRSLINEDGCAYDLEFSQFTGLRDKNGKEIYEGDIVILDGGLRWICKWSDNHVRFYFDTGLHKTTDFSSQESGNFEVIGNIYENPDLLK